MTIPVNDGLLQVFDVEHGACALLTMPSQAGFMRMMIDCGHNASSGFAPGSHLRKLHASKLEQLVITNYDEDHVSGFPNLEASGIEIQWLMRNPSVTAGDIRSLKSEDGMGRGIDALVTALNRPKTAAQIIYPAAEPVFPGVQHAAFWNVYRVSRFDDENNLSLVFFLNVHGVHFMFPGDMECAGFENLLAGNQDFRAWVAKTDVLMASHHGRENGICPDMFDRHGCKPTLVVISDDYKQYSTQETTAYYASKASGITGFRSEQGRRRVLTTRSDGEILFQFRDGGCHVN